MKLLIIENNQRLVERLKNRLGKKYLVDIAYSGGEGLEKAGNDQYNVIILDLGLPDVSGEVVCKKLREAGIPTPILVLTGVDEMDARVKLLTMGADDYMTKPFDGNELIARITALGRRQALQYTNSVIKLHDLVMDTQQRKVYRSGVPIALRRKEFDILEYLINNKGRVLTREMILNHAWDTRRSGWHNTVDVHIKHLRDKIDRPFNTSLIKTAYGIGYRFDIPE